MQKLSDTLFYWKFFHGNFVSIINHGHDALDNDAVAQGVEMSEALETGGR
jgi:hypothetical protein